MLGQDFTLGYSTITNNGGTLVGNSPVAQAIAGTRADVGLLRPYFKDDGFAYVTVNTRRTKEVKKKNKRTGQVIVEREPIYEEVRVKDLQDDGIQLPLVTTNGTGLRKEEWVMYDKALIPPQLERLRFYDDVARIDTLSFPGLGVKMLEHETQSKFGKAYWDMDGRSEGTDDGPLFQLEGIPIGVLHAHMAIDLRTLENTRRTGMPLSTRGISELTRRILELREDLAVGIAGNAPLYGTATQVSGYGRTPGNYGLLNFPDRITKTDLTVPTGSNPEAILADVLEMRELLYDAHHYGPYGIYHSTDYDRYLDDDYARLGGDNASMTLRQRILAIGTEGGTGANNTQERQIRFVKRLDRLTPSASHAFTMVMVSLNPGVIRALNGMPITVFQYESRGGWEINIMVACINQIEMFADYYGNAGVLHARTA